MEFKVRSRMRIMGLAALLLILLSACFKKDVGVRLKLAVKTNHGEAVNGAVVSLDGKPLGETNDTGDFETEVQLPSGVRARLEVKKESEDYYFAPYYETFAITDDATQSMTVNATMYFVPKPGSAKEQPEAKTAPSVASETNATETSRLEGEDSSLGSSADADAASPTPGDSTQEQVKPAPEQVADTEDLSQTIESDADQASDAAASDQKGEKPQLAKEAEPSSSEPKEESPPSVKPEVDVATDAKAAESVSEAEGAQPPPVEPVVVSLPSLDFTQDLKKSSYPKIASSIGGQIVFTLHAYSGALPLADANILLGHEADGDLKVACTTNARGRCVVRFQTAPEAAVTFVATKAGFKTKSTTVEVKDKGKLRFDLDRGQTLDIYAVTKSYHYAVGLKDVEIRVNGKRVGETDRFGRYSYLYQGKKDDLMTITMVPKGHLPETFETDFVAAGPMQLVKHFTPVNAPAVRMSVIDARAAGTIDKKAIDVLASATDSVRAASRKHIFGSAAFKEVLPPLLDKALLRSGVSGSQMLKSGWADNDLKGVVDALLVPTVSSGPEPALELSVVDSQARVLAAARESLGSTADAASIDRAVSVLAKKIARVFPFEGAVTSKDGDKVEINLGYSSGRGLKAGDQLEVWGMQAGKKGNVQEHGRIGLLTLREVFDNTSKCSVTKLAPRAVVERGDLVTLRVRRAPDSQSPEVRVTGNAKGLKAEAIAQANVYFNEQWIGATDASGRLYVDATGTGTMRVVRHGYQDSTQQVSLTATSKVEVNLRREVAFLRVDSKPQQATVKVEGKVVGKTPLTAPVSVPAGFIKLEIEAGPGFKPYSAVLELDQGTLDLTGKSAINLEADLRAIALRHLKAGETEKALSAYAEIPKGHSDYLLSRHETGEVLLTILDRPAEAAAAFGEVTADEAVKQFSDKRFIGSHIDEGIALFMTAEKLGSTRSEEALAHYRKAISVFDAVIPHLRFVPPEQYGQAVHNVDFHRALARHRLWLGTQDPAMLAEAVKTWRGYLDGSARAVPADESSKAYVENASVYLKQAVASLDAAKGVSKQ